MSLLRYEPWGTNNWPSDVFRLFDNLAAANSEAPTTRDWQPRVDIVEFDDRYDIQADLPGVDPQSVDITLENKQLNISGQRPVNAEAENAQSQRLERPSGSFSRRFTLPDTADVENINARSEHGVIHISIPKRSQAQAVKISIAA